MSMKLTPLPAGSLRATSLNARRRRMELDALAAGEVVDVLVIGGGISGCGIALDAASRGLSVALLEAEDLAFGTSRWSSKLVHGGLRHLRTGEVGLARECAAERGLLMTRTAPHLVRAVPLLIPRYQGRSSLARPALRAASMMGDLLRLASRTPRALIPRPRVLTPEEAIALIPGLLPTGLTGGLLYFEGQLVDDARLAVALARTAAGFGAKIITRARVMTAVGDGVDVQDTLTGRRFSVFARSVINATGVWARQLVADVPIVAARGSHLIVDSAAAGMSTTGLTATIPGPGHRSVLLLPGDDGRLLVGVTDEPVDGPLPRVPEVPDADVGYLLQAASTVLARPLTRADIVGRFAGLRPLLAGYKPSSRSAALSRHVLGASADGIVTAVGGTLTTYRRMAEEAVDVVVRQRGLGAGSSRTSRVPLVGAGTARELADVVAPRRLVARYGVEAARVAAVGGTAPLARGIGVTGAEVVWALRHEGALDADDVLDRRLRLDLIPGGRERVHEVVNELLAQENDRDDE